jgi:N-acetylglucosamine-6-sulfatase
VTTTPDEGAAVKHRMSTVIVSIMTIASVLLGVGGLALLTANGGRTAAAAALETPDPSPSPSVSETSPAQTSAETPKFRNVVMVLADDLDWDLYQQVPRLRGISDLGTTFANNLVTDSLCCPSRVSILRSQYVHNHKVISNLASTGGGFAKFAALGQQRDCLPVWLDRAGVRTGLFGKYMNEFPAPFQLGYVPPGWDEFVSPVGNKNAYRGYGYTLIDNGKVKEAGKKPKDFMNDVIDRKTSEFIRTSKDEPFFAFVSSFSPHSPFPVAPRYKNVPTPFVGVPRTPVYNAADPARPDWLKPRTALTSTRLALLDKRWNQRARSALSIADSVDNVLATLRATGHADDTLVIVTSDNGYHHASRQLPVGKRTPYREDTVVPMVMIGKGIPAGRVVTDLTSTIDLAPTIAEVMGARVPSWLDGRSLVGYLGGGTPETVRTGLLTESLGRSRPGDPDWSRYNPPNFHALRTPTHLFVRYADGDEELYDRVKDPQETTNIITTADPTQLNLLRTQLAALKGCRGASCRTADVLPNTTVAFVTPTPEQSPLTQVP